VPACWLYDKDGLLHLVTRRIKIGILRNRGRYCFPATSPTVAASPPLLRPLFLPMVRRVDSAASERFILPEASDTLDAEEFALIAKAV
jgi:hypothetical protein